MLTNSAGAVTDTYSYDAFGNLIDATGSTPNPYLYRGERYDADLGLYYLRARWYNPVTGRFMTRDPYSGSIYDPASLHRYNYARSNPANFIDPSGRDSAEYGLNLKSFVGRTAGVTAFSYVVTCGYYSLASAEHLVGQNMGQDITELRLLFSQCAARITATDYVERFLLFATGDLAVQGFGWLQDAAQGFDWEEFLADETGSIGPTKELRRKLLRAISSWAVPVAAPVCGA